MYWIQKLSHQNRTGLLCGMISLLTKKIRFEYNLIDLTLRVFLSVCMCVATLVLLGVIRPSNIFQCQFVNLLPTVGTSWHVAAFSLCKNNNNNQHLRKFSTFSRVIVWTLSEGFICILWILVTHCLEGEDVCVNRLILLIKQMLGVCVFAVRGFWLVVGMMQSHSRLSTFDVGLIGGQNTESGFFTRNFGFPEQLLPVSQTW